jgi:hypothetical protein
LPDLRSASDVRKGLAFRRGRQDEGKLFQDRARLRVGLPRRAARGSPGHGPSPRRPDSMHFSRPMADGSAASDDQFHASPAPSTGRAGGSSGDAQADMPSGQASGATCVQKLDDSRNSAIHTTYRISLRSSSLREPRYPLLRVVCYSSRFAFPPPAARAPPGRGKGRLRLARSNMVRGASAGQPDSRPPPPAGELARERAELAPEAGKADEASSPSEGGPHASEARPRGPLPARTRSPGGRRRVRRVYRSVCAMILPQVHLRKPCYDFSFL